MCILNLKHHIPKIDMTHKEFIRILSLSIILLITSLSASAKIDLPIKNINGKDYYYYKVKSKETIYGISHKLNISQDKILKYNPAAISGLKDKQLLFFPVSDFSETENEKQKTETVELPERNVFTHVVKSGETVYGLANLYNTTVDKIISENPDVKNGLKAGQVLKFSQEKESSIFVTVKTGDTLFSMAKKYNTSVENIMNENPGVSANNFKAGSVIRITPNSSKLVPTERTITGFYPYEVKQGDTFYSISREKGVSVAEIIASNPGVGNLKKGSFIYIPETRKDTVLISNSHPVNSPNNDLADKIYNDVHKSKYDDTVNVALMLPFMLKSSSPSKSARLFTEFYKGFLLAVDETRTKTSMKINIYAYDTNNSIDEINSILSKSELKKMDFIFAPDDLAHISVIAKFGKDNKINVINTFSTKSEEYANNPYFFQVNIPHSYMSHKVKEWFCETFKGYTVIFLTTSDSGSKGTVSEYKQYINGKNPSIELDLATDFDVESFSAKLKAGGKYVVIPGSSSKKVLNNILPILAKVKDERLDIDLTLVGHPEWTTYTSSFQNEFKKIDTQFYSRFFIDPSEYRIKTFETKYQKWYGENMIYAAPKFGLLGYDTGIFFLQSYIENNSDFNKKGFNYSGLQSDFNFERASNWSGFINNTLYFIHYTPYSSTKRTPK